MSVYEKLTAVQVELKAPKSQYNKFGKYNYRNCEDILEALKPLLSKHKLSLYLSDEITQIGERFYVKVTATLRSTDDHGETITVTAFAREAESKSGMDASQITGASSSYARKYALNGLFAIDDTKDNDTPLKDPNDEPPENDENKTDWRQEYIRVCKEKNIDSVAYAQKHGINKKTTQAQYKEIVAALQANTENSGVVSINNI